MKHLLSVFLLFPICSFSQESDSLKQSKYETFFGSDCPLNAKILTESIGKKEKYILHVDDYNQKRLHHYFWLYK